MTVDLVVAADGIHSHTRAMILAENEVEHFETGWGGYVLWSPLDGQEDDTYHELWSAGWGVGLYPVPGHLGVFIAGRDAEIADRQPQEIAEEYGRKDLPEPFVRALRERERTESSFYWKMADIKSRVWWRDRTVLLGDAAAAFLPTAGVGASVAMDSAAALSDELARADAAHLEFALSLYEKRQRNRAERAQKNSRDLARFMFVNNPLVAFGRDQFMRVYTLKQLIRDISKVMEGV
jgi:2-polyprenyl-6-methoxyphenol hydroxylase-like FAD-dependent oxidoreductase